MLQGCCAIFRNNHCGTHAILDHGFGVYSLVLESTFHLMTVLTAAVMHVFAEIMIPPEPVFVRRLMK